MKNNDPLATTLKMIRALGRTQRKVGIARDTNVANKPRGTNQSMETESKAREVVDGRIASIIQSNPQHANKLSTLFATLKKFDITLNAESFSAIQNCPLNAGIVVHLLEFIHEKGLDIRHIPLPYFFRAAKYPQSFRQGITNLEKSDNLGRAGLNALLAHPEHGIRVSELLNNFQSHSYSLDTLTLLLSQIATENMLSVINTLNITLDSNIFYERILEILLRQQEYAEKINKGSIRLSQEDLLTSAYFEGVDTNPVNALVLAKIILLLQLVELVKPDDDEELKATSILGVGAYTLLNHLKQAQMLTSATYRIVYNNNTVLAEAEVIAAFQGIPLGVALNADELTDILRILDSKDESHIKIEGLVSSLRQHHIPGPQMV